MTYSCQFPLIGCVITSVALPEETLYMYISNMTRSRVYVQLVELDDNHIVVSHGLLI